jgi:hypothetical protein
MFQVYEIPPNTRSQLLTPNCYRYRRWTTKKSRKEINVNESQSRRASAGGIAAEALWNSRELPSCRSFSRGGATIESFKSIDGFSFNDDRVCDLIAHSIT